MGATYHMLMNIILQGCIGETIEVYIDDIVVNFSRRSTHLDDLEDIFKQFESYNVRLNLN